MCALFIHPIARLIFAVGWACAAAYFIWLIWSEQSLGYMGSIALIIFGVWSIAAGRAKKGSDN